jgi:hypothetical protein
MNVINRVALAVICLALIVGSIAVIALAWVEPQGSIDWLADAAAWLDDHNSDGTKIVISAAGAVLGFLAFIVLLMELSPQSGREVRVSGLMVGDAVLTTAAIGQRVEEAVNQVPAVSDVRATVRAKRKGVIVLLDLYVDPDANLAAVIDASCEAARVVLTERVHVELAAPPRVRLHYRELRLRGRQGRPIRPGRPVSPARVSDSMEPQTVESAPDTERVPAAVGATQESGAPVAVAEEEKPGQG